VNGRSARTEIAPDEWSELDYSYCNTSLSNAIGSLETVKYWDLSFSRSDVLALWPEVQHTKGQLKRGPKRKVPQEEIDNVVFELFEYHGPLSDDDPEWRTKGQLEVATRDELDKKFGASNVPGESTLRNYINNSYEKWLNQRS
jgi:hypothetical protein